jgi:hypothetical protein
MEKIAEMLQALAFVEDTSAPPNENPLSRFTITMPLPKKKGITQGGITFGGRLRYRRGDLYVTVGARVTYMYRRSSGELVEPIGSFSTANDIDKIREKIQEVAQAG